MSLSCSGDLNLSFEYPFDSLDLLLDEKSIKNCAQESFSGELAKKNDFFAGRHPLKIFLPNKKHYSVVSDGIRNFLAGGPVNLFLTSPPTKAGQSIAREV